MRLGPLVVAALGALAAGVLIAVVVLIGSPDSRTSVQTFGPVERTEHVGDEPADPERSDDRTLAAESPLARTLSAGRTGDDVARLQERLIELGLDPGPVHGGFGPQTLEAVRAFEKLVMGVPRDEATGFVTAEMWERMQEPLRVHARRPSGGGDPHVELYLPEQLLIVFDGDQPALISHVSTGADRPFCDRVFFDTALDGARLPEVVEGEVCGVSRTPGGVFAVGREMLGTLSTPLGSLVNPVYLEGGLVIHGTEAVAGKPVSRGDVRIPLRLTASLQELVEIGDLVYVWDGQHEPEHVPPDERSPEVEVRLVAGESHSSPPTSCVCSRQR